MRTNAGASSFLHRLYLCAICGRGISIQGVQQRRLCSTGGTCGVGCTLDKFISRVSQILEMKKASTFGKGIFYAPFDAWYDRGSTFCLFCFCMIGLRNPKSSDFLFLCSKIVHYILRHAIVHWVALARSSDAHLPLAILTRKKNIHAPYPQINNGSM